MIPKPVFTAAMPYGAFELKRWYQWNMMMATLIMAGAVTVIWGGLFIYQLVIAEEVVTLETLLIESVLDLPPPPPVAQKPPQIEITKPDIAQPKIGIPKPVADDELLEEDVVLATKEELAEVNLTDFDYSSDGASIKISEDFLPSSTAFIKVEVQPKFVKRVVPDYPHLARRSSTEGIVWVKILVDKTGKVRDVLIAKSSGTQAGFEEAALAAAKLCEFSPAIQNGRPIAIWVTFPFEFVLH
ncbi:MAG: energy transducer TonB [candidate division Zixibacteria bacterium]|nr:energy transducer TonB [candidate division Zixibacteria bacterium]